MINWKKVAWWLLWTFLLSYGFGFAAYFFKLNQYMPLFMGFGVIYMFFPTIAVLIVQKGMYKESIKELGINWKINRWWFIAWFSMPLFAIAVFGASLLLPQVQYSPEMEGMFERYGKLLTPEQVDAMRVQMEKLPIHVFWITLLQGLIAAVTINAVAGFGEELGWRGFLLKNLLPMGFWKSSLLIGFIWGVWHLPMILQGLNYPEHPKLGVLWMVVFCMLLAPIFQYFTLKGKSVFVAAIVHGSLNASAGLGVLMIKGGHDLIIGITGLVGFTILIVFNVVLWIFDKFIATDKIM